MPAGSHDSTDSASDECIRIYESSGIAEYVDYAVFEHAWEGYRLIKGRSKNILTLVDFTKPSTVERLYVIDMEHACVVHKSHVAHGKNSGDKYATSFSNRNGSHKSSLGFYLTGQTYDGDNGYSLRLQGLEKGINDCAMERSIVVHAADYANPSTISSSGRLGRSFGCPALPESLNDEIINTIKDGTVFYIYADYPEYVQKSTFLASNGV